MRFRKRFDFGDAGNYDRVRPDYPDALVDDVIAFAGVPDRGPALDVGCGTGKATVAFAQRGVEILAIDPLPAMTEVARKACAPYANVEVRTVGFEDWTPAPPAPFALVFAAAAWHMVRQDFGLAKAHAVLKPDGALALFRYRTVWTDHPLRTPLIDVYRHLAPDLAAGSQWNPAAERRDKFDEWAGGVTASAHFAAPVTHAYVASKTYATTEYLGLLQTQRDHAQLKSKEQRRLFEAIAQLLGEQGGEIRVDRSFRLLLARRLPD